MASNEAPAGEPNVIECPFPPLPSGEVDRIRTMRPVFGNIDAPQISIGGGVAIFHLASARVVLCYHSRAKYYFLPKGRRDVNEDSAEGAEREGFEESGYRNRVLPLPLPHNQPQPADPGTGRPKKILFHTEPVLTQLMPVGRGNQYMLHWYVAETLSAELEEEVNAESAERVKQGLGAYVRPRKWAEYETLSGRVSQDIAQEESMSEAQAAETIADSKQSKQQNSGLAKEKKVYEPRKHEGTGVDEDEAYYVSSLVPIPEALERLHNTGMDYVVEMGWAGILERWSMEVEGV